MLQCSVWHSAHETLEIGWPYCTLGTCYGSSVGLSCLNLGSGIFKTVGVISRQVPFAGSDSALKGKNLSS